MTAKKKTKEKQVQSPYQEVLEELPPHLRLFAVEQDYSLYTPVDQAAWRFVMRNHLQYFAKHGYGQYGQWIRRTGITVEEIPSIDHLNLCLGKIGWRAVIVNGFIPPSIFMEFQEYRIFPVSAEMRSVDHLLYTPAPDIVHEAAGHIPIVADVEYAKFLQKVGEIGGKSISTKKDYEVYEAIRKLSIVKEFPGATEREIQEAEVELQQALKNNPTPSEASKMSRFHWWTVEYGLIGTLEAPLIYGAGLLSSMGESRSCLSSSVKKIWLSLDCINTAYDITKEQPQLFVVRDWAHLHQVLEEFAQTMAFRKGGLSSLRLAHESERDATVVYSSGLQVSGLLTQIMEEGDEAVYLQFSGPTSLSFSNKELKGHGIENHPHGFGSPVGNLKNLKRPWENLNAQDLSELGIQEGKITNLEFESGITVIGEILEIKRKENKKIILISFSNCTVRDRQGKILFDPSYGQFDMAVGSTIISVFSGPADREKYSTKPHKSERNAMVTQFSEKDKIRFKLFEKIKRLRNSCEKGGVLDVDEIYSVFSQMKKDYSTDWLLHFEVLEVLTRFGGETSSHLEAELSEALHNLKLVNSTFSTLVDRALKLIETSPAN